MSYEGHNQNLCKNGHYWVDYDYSSEDPRCFTCKQPPVWSNAVDDTNGESHGFIPLAVLRERFQVSPEKRETCNLGHSHVTEREVFRIPTKEETSRLHHWVPDPDQPPVLLPPEQVQLSLSGCRS